MATKFVINVDLADVWAERNRKKLIRTLAWGDEVDVVKQTRDYAEVDITEFIEEKDGSILPKKTTGYIQPPKNLGLKLTDVIIPRKQNKVLKINFVDVQQGDGSVIESPLGKVVLVDGGDNQLFARYLASRFRNTSLDKPKEIECILVNSWRCRPFRRLTENSKIRKK